MVVLNTEGNGESITTSTSFPSFTANTSTFGPTPENTESDGAAVEDEKLPQADTTRGGEIKNNLPPKINLAELGDVEKLKVQRKVTRFAEAYRTWLHGRLTAHRCHLSSSLKRCTESIAEAASALASFDEYIESDYMDIVAADSQFLNIRRDLQYWCSALARELEVTPDSQSEGVPSVAELRTEIYAVLRNFHAKFIDGETLLEVYLPETILADEVFGPYCVSIAFSNERRLYSVRDFGTRRHSYGSPHPHVSIDGYLCEGDGVLAIRTAIEGGHLVDMLDLVQAVLNEYEPDSAYWEIGEEREECHNCGASSTVEDMYSCNGCSNRLCGECGACCSCCEALLCDNCYTSCECETTMCAECATSCDSCGDILCTGCSESCANCDNVTCHNCSYDMEPSDRVAIGAPKHGVFCNGCYAEFKEKLKAIVPVESDETEEDEDQDDE